MDERRIEGLAPELGRGAAERVDADATAGAVIERLRQPVRVAWWRSPALRVAAALVLVLGGGLLVRGAVSTGERGGEVLAGPVELRQLAAAELEEVLDSLELERPVHELVPVSIGDLDETELRQLLEIMEG